MDKIEFIEKGKDYINLSQACDNFNTEHSSGKGKGNCKFKKEYYNCSLGECNLKLGNWDDGDNYNFDLLINLEGLYYDDFSEPKKIRIQGKGIHELALLATMFGDLSKYIQANI